MICRGCAAGGIFYGKEENIKDIIVADLGSTDGTKEIIHKMSLDYDYVKTTNWRECKEIIDNIKFSSFFLRDLDSDGYAEKLKGTCKEIGKEDTLYMELNVQTAGYLKNAKVQTAVLWLRFCVF